MKQKIQGKLTNIGRNLYKDKSGKIYIYVEKQNLAYVLDKNDQLKFQLYRCRFIIPITAGFLVHYYYPNYVLALLIGSVFFILLQTLYHQRFLPNLSMTNRFELPQKEPYMKKISNNDSQVLIRRIIGALIIGSIFIWNLYEMNITVSDFENINDWNRILMLLLSIAMIVSTFTASFIYFKVLMKKRRGVRV